MGSIQDSLKVLNQVQELVTSVLALLVIAQGTEQSAWFVACDEALRLLFAVHTKPEEMADHFITCLCEFIIEHKRKHLLAQQKEREKANQFLCDMVQEQKVTLFDQLSEVPGVRNPKQLDFE
jgi:hypothetical protein